MTVVLDRMLRVLEMLAVNASGLQLHAIADGLGFPRSATHRLLADLTRNGYVRQEGEQGRYQLTIRLAALGLTYLAQNGIVDVAQPVLDRLAQASGELVRLSIIDGDRLTWVAKAQGARGGLRYDPDMGMDAHLSSTATGQAWLATLPDGEVAAMVGRQGFATEGRYGPNAPRTLAALMRRLRLARGRGFSVVTDSFEPGMSAMAASVRHPVRDTSLGVLSIAGPGVRLTERRMLDLGPELLAAARELSLVSQGSPTMGARPPRAAGS